ncbi:MAG: glycosyltransferase family 1 protein [Methylobacter sp.]
MKIAFDSQIFTMQEYGGISRYICSLAAHLADIEGVEASIIAPFYINAYLENLPKGIVSGIRIPKIPKTGRAFHRSGLWLARGAIARLAPQIVHETYYNATPIAPKGARTVVTVYDMIHELFPAAFPQHDRTSERKRIATQRADHVLCISESTRRDLLELFGLPEDKVSVVYLGFDRLPPMILESDHKKPYLLYVGYRSDYKNFEGFLRAYAGSPWLRNNFDVVSFGGDAFSSIEKKLFDDLKLSDNQLLQMNGNDSELANAYRGAALFVYPSLYEGFGIPPLEAMSLGCPVACSNNSSVPEVVGSAAEQFDPKDTESIRTALERVLNSTARRTELIDKGHVRCGQFSWERCAEETLAVYRSLM